LFIVQGLNCYEFFPEIERQVKKNFFFKSSLSPPAISGGYNQNNYEEKFTRKIKNNLPGFEKYFFRAWDFLFN